MYLAHQTIRNSRHCTQSLHRPTNKEYPARRWCLYAGPSESGLKGFEKCFHCYTRSENWKVLTFTLFRDLQSETFLLSLFFKKGNQNDLRSRSRSEFSPDFSEKSRETRFWTWFFFFQNQTQNMVERRVNLNFSPWPHIFMKNARWFYKGCFHSFFLRNGSKNTQLSTSVEVKRKWSEIGNKKWNLQEKILENSQETGFSLGTACLTTIDFYSSPKLHQYWPWFVDWEW